MATHFGDDTVIKISIAVGLPLANSKMTTKDEAASRAHYLPPWADVTIIGIAGSSGSGKSTLSHAIVSQLNLPWVVILSMVIFSVVNDVLLAEL